MERHQGGAAFTTARPLRFGQHVDGIAHVDSIHPPARLPRSPAAWGGWPSGRPSLKDCRAAGCPRHTGFDDGWQRNPAATRWPMRHRFPQMLSLRFFQVHANAPDARFQRTAYEAKEGKGGTFLGCQQVACPPHALRVGYSLSAPLLLRPSFMPRPVPPPWPRRPSSAVRPKAETCFAAMRAAAPAAPARRARRRAMCGPGSSLSRRSCTSSTPASGAAMRPPRFPHRSRASGHPSAGQQPHRRGRRGRRPPRPRSGSRSCKACSASHRGRRPRGMPAHRAGRGRAQPSEQRQ